MRCLLRLLTHTGVRVSEIPAIDVDNSAGPFTGRLYMVFYTWTGSYMQVEVIASSDRGATWSVPIPVTSGTLAWDDFFPWLSVNNSGVVGVTWLEAAPIHSIVNTRPLPRLTRWGASSGSNVRIASKPSPPSGFMGDYTGKPNGTATSCTRPGRIAAAAVCRTRWAATISYKYAHLTGFEVLGDTSMGEVACFPNHPYTLEQISSGKICVNASFEGRTAKDERKASLLYYGDGMQIPPYHPRVRKLTGV